MLYLILSAICDNCYGATSELHYFPRVIILIILLLFWVIPRVIINLFSIASACHLKKSIRKLSNEAVEMEEFIHARAHNVLVVLILVSALRYIQFYLLFFLYAWNYINIYPTTYYLSTGPPYVKFVSWYLNVLLLSL